jgi:hypothetical protein
MSINEILEEQGWKLVERQGWVAVQDPRPEFRASFTTNRVGKIIDTSFHVTLQMPEVVKGLIRQLGREPVSIKSTSGTRDATYWGFDSAGVPVESLKTFVRRLAISIDDLI